MAVWVYEALRPEWVFAVGGSVPAFVCAPTLTGKVWELWGGKTHLSGDLDLICWAKEEFRVLVELWPKRAAFVSIPQSALIAHRRSLFGVFLWRRAWPRLLERMTLKRGELSSVMVSTSCLSALVPWAKGSILPNHFSRLNWNILNLQYVDRTPQASLSV